MSWGEKYINKVVCGDCLELLKEIPDESVDLIITDPPYGVLPNGKPNDNFNWDSIDLVPFTKNWFNLCFEKLKRDKFMFVFWSQKYLKEGFKIFNPNRILIWHYKNLILGGNGVFAYDYEPILVLAKGNPKLCKGKHSCILTYTKPQSNFKKDKLLHPTQKPIELIKYLIKINSLNNGLVLDPFLGCGTTAVACKMLGKDSIGTEINPDYCEIARKRIKETSEIFSYQAVLLR